jgi:hypothetical protein
VTLSALPDLSSRRQLAITTLLVWLALAGSLAVARFSHLGVSLGDTDDALRLTMVRDLASGQGWFDQKLTRLQPPLGLYMHWSRLIDGGEAALLKLFGLILPPAQAETAMRLTWPLLWLAPAVAAVLLIARRLGGGTAVFLTAVGMVCLSLSLTVQFQPGRVDHHNVQIACCLMALAAAVQRPSRAWAAACGLATALGLAIGLETLPFLALIGAAVALAWAFGRTSAREPIAYGAALAAGALVLHLIQTPPGRWTVTACDALAANLVAGLLVAGAGLALAAAAGARAGTGGRIAMLAIVGVAAGGAYLALEPLCLHGPMAAIDPELKRLWLSKIREMKPWPSLAASAPGEAILLAAPVVIGALAWLWLGRRREARADTAWRLCGAMIIVSGLMGLTAIRGAECAVWFFAPVFGAAGADLAAAVMGRRMIPAVALVMGVSFAPVCAMAALPDRARASGQDHCADTAAFAPLSRLPPGLVLGEIDAGPYILANTPQSAVQAPYHRMTWGILSGLHALAAPIVRAEGQVRGLHVTYVLDCPAHIRQADRVGLPADSLQTQLDRGRVPAWLEPLSRPTQPLQIYRVR